MSFIQDPRVRQRWNQLSQNAEAVTENAAAGIWSFQQRYINPCLVGFGDAVDTCTGVCIGDREERARRARERARGARPTRAEYTFDFYDDWEDADDEGAGGSVSGSGILGGWSGGASADWDRLLAGSGAGRSRHAAVAAGDVVDQPRRKRGMSYGTRGVVRRKPPAGEDPNVIPRTAPLGFLGRLPFNIGGNLRYKPSAANLQDHPGTLAHENGEGGEHEPLLGTSDEEEEPRMRRSPQSRPRSNTTQSGGTSSSFRSRNDLFPSDGEGEEDAVPLDDEFAMALDRVDDRSSTKTRSTKGKYPAGPSGGMSRTVSRTTIGSMRSLDSHSGPNASATVSPSQADEEPEQDVSHPSLEDLRREEELAEMEETEERERQRKAASQLALERGLSRDDIGDQTGPTGEPQRAVSVDVPPGDDEDEFPEVFSVLPPQAGVDGRPVEVVLEETKHPSVSDISLTQKDTGGFVPARLPHFS
ncbi:hypothetical protein QBC39DRAFT_359299 [Podospora conica]|nr:hypothetical protein QBC39DRAFT_359299 [Schizothecium conicum]